ncbi:MAG: hydrogen gas-evolving membrane-bound hydrogenase subunit E [Candidatus Bathyarchaeia archaeon]
MRAKEAAAMLFLAMVVLAFAIIFTLSFPSFGSGRELAIRYYLPRALEETGALNVVTTIVWDYRGYDTLGETTVFFAAAIGALLLFRRREH